MSDLDLLILGDLNPDLVLKGQDIRPRFGQVETIVDSADLVIGGSAAIAAVGASRLGLSVGLCAVVGDDPRGQTIREMVEAEGVDTGSVRTAVGVSTGLTVILAERDDRAILTFPGTIEALSVDDLALLPDAPARHVHVASYFLMSGAYQAGLPAHLLRFKNAGCTISLDTNWDPSQRWDLTDILGAVDVLLPNEEECLAITSEGTIEDAIRTLGNIVSTIAVKLGKRGGAVLSEGTITTVSADLSGSFVDAIGAGDSFDAGFIAGMLAHQSTSGALELAVAAGTLSTRGIGGTAAQPNIEEVTHLVRSK
jgi:sugar/nucleoside kinase (ribokinase family)